MKPHEMTAKLLRECKKTLNLKRKQNLKQLSLKVRKESMAINAEFSRIEHDFEVL